MNLSPDSPDIPSTDYPHLSKFSLTQLIPSGPFLFRSSLKGKAGLKKQVSLSSLAIPSTLFYQVLLPSINMVGFSWLPCLCSFCLESSSLALYPLLSCHAGFRLNATFFLELFMPPFYPAVYPTVIIFSLAHNLSSSTNKAECVHDCTVSTAFGTVMGTC